MNDGSGEVAAAVVKARRHLTPEEVARLNTIHSRGAAIGFRGLGLDLELSFTADPPEFRPALAVDLAVDGAPVTICLEDFFFAKAVEELLPELAVGAVPPSLKAAAVEVAIAEIVEEFQKATGRKVAVAAVREHPDWPAAEPRLGFILHAVDGADRVAGWLGGDSRTLALVGELLRDRPLAARHALDELPLPVRLEIGTTALPTGDFQSLAPQDIILVEECHLAADGSLIVRLAPHLAFKARMTETTITVTEPAKDTMAQDASKPARPAADKLAEIEVHLVFELGEKSLTLQEIRAIDKGYVFDLGKDYRRAIAIRANGRLVGTGELVEIEDRLGVRVLELAGQ